MLWAHLFAHRRLDETRVLFRHLPLTSTSTWNCVCFTSYLTQNTFRLLFIMPGPHAATSACAGDCLAVHLQEGESKGSIFDISLPLSGTIGTYIACPPGATSDSLKEKKAKRVILWACDVYGPRFINNQLLMDWHASNGRFPPFLASSRFVLIDTLVRLPRGISGLLSGRRARPFPIQPGIRPYGMDQQVQEDSQRRERQRY